MNGISKKHSKLETFILEFFFVALFAYMPSARPSDTIVWAGAFLLLAADSVLRFLNGKRIPIDGSIVWYVLVVFWGFISCLWSKDTTQFGLYILLYFSVILIGSIFAGMHINNQEDIDYSMKLMILAGCFAGLRFCYYTPWDTILSSGYYMRGTFGSLLDNVTNYNQYTTHLCILTIIAAYYAVVKKVKWCWGSYLLLFAILIFGGSRKNLVVIPLITIFFAMSTGSLSRRMKNLLLVLAAVIVALYALLTLDFLSQIRDTFFQMLSGLSNAEKVVDQSTRERTYLIQSGLEVWEEHLLLGVGWDNYRYYNVLHVYAHNSYVEMLACLGLIGFILYYSYYVKILATVVLRFVRKNGSQLDVLMCGVIVGFVIQEYGAITIYGRERMIMFLVLSTAYSIGTGNKVKYLAVRK